MNLGAYQEKCMKPLSPNIVLRVTVLTYICNKVKIAVFFDEIRQFEILYSYLVIYI